MKLSRHCLERLIERAEIPAENISDQKLKKIAKALIASSDMEIPWSEKCVALRTVVGLFIILKHKNIALTFLSWDDLAPSRRRTLQVLNAA